MIPPIQAIDLARQLIVGYEGLGGAHPDGKYYPYHCGADKPGVMTEGNGHLIKSPEELARFSKGLTLAEVSQLFELDLKPRADRLHMLLNGVYTAEQFAACLSLYYNIEQPFAPGMSVGTRHKKGDYRGAAAGMLLYVMSDGKKQLGLYRRRMSEALCYLTGEVLIAKTGQAEAKLETRLRQVLTFVRPKGLQ